MEAGLLLASTVHSGSTVLHRVRESVSRALVHAITCPLSDSPLRPSTSGPYGKLDRVPYAFSYTSLLAGLHARRATLRYLPTRQLQRAVSWLCGTRSTTRLSTVQDGVPVQFTECYSFIYVTLERSGARGHVMIRTYCIFVQYYSTPKFLLPYSN